MEGEVPAARSKEGGGERAGWVHGPKQQLVRRADGAGPAGLALPALDPWQLALLQEQAVQACRQLALEHERLREATALDAKSPAGAQARAAWRRLQSAETHLAWLRSVQSAL